MIQELEVEILENLIHQEQHIEILDKIVRSLRNNEIPMVRIKWGYHSSKEAIWKVEKDM